MTSVGLAHARPNYDHLLHVSRPNFQNIFMCVYCITHRKIKASCDKGVPYIAHVIYRLTDISSPCHMTAKKSRVKINSVPLPTLQPADLQLNL